MPPLTGLSFVTVTAPDQLSVAVAAGSVYGAPPGPVCCSRTEPGASIVGPVRSATFTVICDVAVAKCISETVSVMEWIPNGSDTVAGFVVASEVAPSVHAYDNASPSGSEAVPLSVAAPLEQVLPTATVWSAPADAVGGRFSGVIGPIL